jgi:hypothetical protein
MTLLNILVYIKFLDTKSHLNALGHLLIINSFVNFYLKTGQAFCKETMTFKSPMGWFRYLNIRLAWSAGMGSMVLMKEKEKEGILSFSSAPLNSAADGGEAGLGPDTINTNFGLDTRAVFTRLDV